MDINRRSFACAMSATAAAVLAGCGKEGLDRAVVADLKAAHNGESNASAKYAFFAGKCQEAGYLSVAALFRAASFAENIHAGRHAKVLAQYGVEAKAVVKPAVWTDVSAALKEAIKGETYEFTGMYPGFIKTAGDKRVDAAVHSFTHAMEAEKVHAEYYAAALADLDGWKAAGKTFHVCGVCGFTTNDGSVSTCPYCAAPKSKFQTFA